MTIKLFRQMLSYGRPAFSRADKEFVGKFLMPLDGATMDAFGNVIVPVGPSPTVLWSSHTDTVHARGGRYIHHVDKNEIYVPQHSMANCLGADCTTGVYLMHQMIKAKVPGLYVFHRAEEIGAQGARFIVEKTPQVLEGIQAAIAFDRKGFDEIITYQMSRRCASDAFALSLNEAIGMNMKPSPNGSFTDTAKYMGVVPECTNVSVGYFKQHSKAEYQDTVHLEELREQMCSIDTSRLHIERDPKKTEYKSYSYGGAYGRGYTGAYGGRGHTYGKRPTTVNQFVLQRRWDVVDLLLHYGFTVEELEREIALMRDHEMKERARMEAAALFEPKEPKENEPDLFDPAIAEPDPAQPPFEQLKLSK